MAGRTETVNLDAMILREDFATQSQEGQIMFPQYLSGISRQVPWLVRIFASLIFKEKPIIGLRIKCCLYLSVLLMAILFLR